MGQNITIGYQAEIKLLFLIISEQSEEIFLTFSLFPFPFALCPQFPFSLIEFNRYWIGFKHNFAVRAFDSDIADASAEVAGVFDLTPHFQRSAVFDLVVC